MATSNQRDVELNLRVATVGVDSLQKLQEDVGKLAAEGSIAADSALKLAEQIDHVIKSAGQFNAVAQLEQQVADLAAATERSGTTAMAMAQDLTILSEKTQQLAAAESLQRAALEGAQEALDATRDAMTRNRLETEHAERSTTEYRETMRQFKLDELDAAAVVRERAAALREAQAATQAAADEEATMSKALSAATKEADGYARSLSARNTELRDSRAALEEAGVAAKDLAEAERTLITMQNEAFAATERAKGAEVSRKAALEAEAEELRNLSAIEFTTMQQMREASRAEADGIIADANRIEEALRQEAQVAQTAASEIRSAFSTLGTQSVEELRAEIDRVRAAMQTLGTTAGITGPELERAMSVGQSRINALERDIRQATGSLTLMDHATSALSNSWVQLGGAYLAYDIGSRMAKGFVEANTTMEKLRLGLNAVYKDTGVTASQIDFLYQTANRAGVAVGEISPEFLKFTASMTSANVSLKDSNALFAAVAQASGTLGLNGERVTQILGALSQMAGKGTVSMEELRQQLGDALPGALSLTAQGLGITEAQLIKLVTAGNLASRDLFPALTASLQKMAGEVDTVSSKWERFLNALNQTATTVGDAGGLDVIRYSLVALGAAVGLVVIPLTGFIEVVFGLAKAIPVLFGPFGTFMDRMRGIGDIVDGAATRLSKLEDAFLNMVGLGDKAADSTGKVGTSTAQAGQAAAGAQPSWVALGVAFAELVTAQENAIVVATHHSKAIKEQADAMNVLAKLTGDEAQVRETALQGAQAELAANERLAQSKEALAKTFADEKAARIEAASKTADGLKLAAEEIKAIDQKIEKAAAEADQARQQAEATRVLVAAKQLEVQTFGDQSRAIDTLRVAMETAKETAILYAAAERDGTATKELARQAAVDAAVAEGKYRDALKDATAAANAAVQGVHALNTVRKTALDVSMAEAKAAEDRARFYGNEYGVRQAQIQQKQIEIAQMKLSITTILAEADAMDVALNAKIEELVLSGKWTDQMATEMAARRQEIDAKRASADATRAGIAEQERELQNLQLGKDAKAAVNDISKQLTQTLGGETTARGTNAGSIDSENVALQKQLDLLHALSQAQTPGGDPTKTADGFKKNSDGSASGQFNNNLPVDQAFALANGQITDLAAAKAAFQQAKNAYDDMQAFTKLNPGASSFEYQQSTTQLYTKARAQLEKLQAGSDAASGSSSHTVNVNVGGTSTQIGVASAKDGSNLAGLIKVIADASRSAA